MINSQADPESVQEIPAHRNPMTLEEFLENDLEGYEYIKGELVPIHPRQWNTVKSVLTLSAI